MARRDRGRGERTRDALRAAAYRLFLRDGYDGTPVARIAAEAGVSHMTFFRHFPTKEDVVLRDDHDPLLERLVRERPPGEPPVARVRAAVALALPEVYARERENLLLRARLILDAPALRRRMGDSMRGSQDAFERGLAPGSPDDPPLAVRAVAAACTAALAEAVTAWARDGGTGHLPDLADEALAALQDRPGERA
ncbi:TetR/AcrR family transcriptional regulator [Nocardiopsis potens]|uniref:TetR/AcrR family transcriptional regulator n=1 Tax=Nocardiopsis potens TaxID=1246458 RepID=UPI00034DE332|nr:TetR/AcrR family transcriptional regulator [Nocardiopsis potens]